MNKCPSKMSGLGVTLFSDETKRAICFDDKDTGGYYVFVCDDKWQGQFDEWYLTLDDAKRSSGSAQDWKTPEE